MSLSVEKLFNIINIVKNESRNGSSDNQIYYVLRQAGLLPEKFVKDYIETSLDASSCNESEPLILSSDSELSDDEDPHKVFDYFLRAK